MCTRCSQARQVSKSTNQHICSKANIYKTQSSSNANNQFSGCVTPWQDKGADTGKVFEVMEIGGWQQFVGR